MKLDPSIITLKDSENITNIWLKLAMYSTAFTAPSINASEWKNISPICPIYNMASNIIG